jgi:hypothetical protein
MTKPDQITKQTNLCKQQTGHETAGQERICQVCRRGEGGSTHHFCSPAEEPQKRKPTEIWDWHSNAGREGLDHPPFLSNMSAEQNETRGSNEKKVGLLKVPEMKREPAHVINKSPVLIAVHGSNL